MFLTKFKTNPATEDLNDDTISTDVMPESSDDLTEFTEEPEVIGEDGGFEDEMPEDDSVVVEDIDDQVDGVESLTLQIDHLQNLHAAIETFGISPGMMQVADRDGLLSSTFSIIIATEMMTGPYRPEGATSVAALEGVVSAIKNKVSEWAVKAGSAVKFLAIKAGSMIKSAVLKVGELGHRVLSKTWNATKAAGVVIKAHPYKTIAMVLAAIAAVSVVVALCWAFPAAPEGVAAWFGKIKSALGNIKSPFGSIVAKFDGSVPRAEWVKANPFHMYAGGAPPAPATVSALGWTKAALGASCKSLGAGLAKVVSPLSRASTALANSTTGAWAVRSGGAVKTAVMSKAHAAVQTLGATSEFNKHLVSVSIWAVVSFALKVSWMLIRRVVMAGYHLITGTVTKVSYAVSDGGNGAEATA